MAKLSSNSKNFRIRTNAGQFQKYASIKIVEALKQLSEDTKTNVQLVVADELEKKYKENVLGSYAPRTVEGRQVIEYNKSTGQGGHKKKLTYRHTGIFLDSIYTAIEGDMVRVKIKDEQYPEGATTSQVYEWLTKGTMGDEESGKPYPYIKKSGDGWSRNFPTPRHEFEEYTMLHMKGFLESLANDVKNGKYTTYRYTGKKKKRKTYKGEDLSQG